MKSNHQTYVESQMAEKNRLLDLDYELLLEAFLKFREHKWDWLEQTGFIHSSFIELALAVQVADGRCPKERMAEVEEFING